MIGRWEAGNCSDDRSVRFVRDMVARLEKGKIITKNQRSWFDSAVLTDPPPPKNAEKVNRLLAAANLKGMEKISSTLKDFAYKLSRGWNLSEKQKVFMDKLLLQADEIAKNGRWVPTSEDKKKIQTGIDFSRRHSTGYWYGRPGIKAALDECCSWVSGDLTHVDKWAADKIMSLYKGDRHELEAAHDRWSAGSLVETKQGEVGLALGAPEISLKGKPCMSLLINGSTVVKDLDTIKKKRRKKKT